MSISIRAVPQLTIALLLPVALILGLLSIPTTCRCGAEQQHTHTIFEMRNHQHGPTRSADVDTPSRETPRNAASAGDARIEQSTPASAGGFALVLPSIEVPTKDPFRYDITPREHHLHGRVTPPTIPPPRQG